MNIGKMRHRVTVQTASMTKDVVGGDVRTWATTATVWASIDPVKGEEVQGPNQVLAKVTHNVKMRHRALTTEQRLVFDSRIFEIVSVLNIGERDRELLVLCHEAL